MKCSHTLALLSAAVAATLATSLMTGCEADESAPSPPRATFFPTDDKANENAKKREEENKGKQLPTAGPEFPGQSLGTPYSATMITADVATDTAPAMHSDTPAPRSDTPLVAENPPAAPLPTAAPKPTTPSFGTLPHLNTLPTDHYAEGSVSVPGVAYSADFSLGQAIPLPSLPHRNWPVTVIAAQAGVVDHNPTYFHHLPEVYPNLDLFTSTDTGYGTLTTPGAANAAPVVTNVVGNTPGLASAELRNAITGTGTQFNNALAYPQLNSANTNALNAVGLNANGTAGFPTTGTSITALGSDIAESFWLIPQTIALPFEMILEHPFDHVQSRVTVKDPLFLGYLPDGPIVPSAYPGTVQWKYPWTRDLSSTQPITTGTAGGETPDMTPKDRP
jgi:hypothetical protein